MATREPAFASADEEREYLAEGKGELVQIGHRKLGRLLLGRPVDEVMRGRGAER